MSLRLAHGTATALLLIAACHAQAQLMPSQQRAATLYVNNASRLSGLAVADIDGDSIPDPHGITDSFFGTHLVWLSSGRFLPGNGEAPSFFDLDGDLDIDLLVGPRHGQSPTDLTLLANDGTGFFITPVAPLGTTQVQGFAVGSVYRDRRHFGSGICFDATRDRDDRASLRDQGVDQDRADAPCRPHDQCCVHSCGMHLC